MELSGAQLGRDENQGYVLFCIRVPGFLNQGSKSAFLYQGSGLYIESWVLWVGVVLLLHQMAVCGLFSGVCCGRSCAGGSSREPWRFQAGTLAVPSGNPGGSKQEPWRFQAGTLAVARGVCLRCACLLLCRVLWNPFSVNGLCFVGLCGLLCGERVFAPGEKQAFVAMCVCADTLYSEIRVVFGPKGLPTLCHPLGN